MLHNQNISATQLKPTTFIDSDSVSTDSTDSVLEPSPTKHPLPKGKNSYARAKKAEYVYKDYAKAELLYQKAIKTGDRKISAIKDLASLLNQTGRTQEAINLLKKHKNLHITDQSSYKNLLKTLKHHLERQNNSKSFKTILKISFLSTNFTNQDVLKLFPTSLKIVKISFDQEIDQGKLNKFCIVEFSTQSSARKALEKFKGWGDYRVQWVSPGWSVISDAHYAKQKIELHRKNFPTFDYALFDLDLSGNLHCMAIDNNYISEEPIKLIGIEGKLIGNDLIQLIS